MRGVMRVPDDGGSPSYVVLLVELPQEREVGTNNSAGSFKNPVQLLLNMALHSLLELHRPPTLQHGTEVNHKQEAHVPLQCRLIGSSDCVTERAQNIICNTCGKEVSHEGRSTKDCNRTSYETQGITVKSSTQN